MIAWKDLPILMQLEKQIKRNHDPDMLWSGSVELPGGQRVFSGRTGETRKMWGNNSPEVCVH